MFKFSTVVCTYHDIMCLLKRKRVYLVKREISSLINGI